MSDARSDAGASGREPGPEAERDAWLRAALAHAPDADVAAPPALSAAILRAAAESAAKSAARPADVPPPRPWQWLREAWAALARPPVAAGFASVMVAGLVGLIWWDRPMDAAMPRSPVPAAAPGATSPAIDTLPPAAPPTGLARPATTLPVPQDASPSAQARPAPRPDAVAEARRRESIERASKTEERSVAVASTPPAAPVPRAQFEREQSVAPAPVPRDAAARSDRSEQREVARSGADHAGVRLPSQAPATAEAAAAAQADAPAAARPAPAVSAKAAAADSPMHLDEPPLQPGLADSAAARPTARARAILPTMASPLAGLLQTGPADAGAWRWQPPGQEAPQPADAAAQAWLQRIERATRGRWKPAPTVTVEGAPTARWWRGDEPRGTLVFEPDGLRWLGPPGEGAARVPLDAATVEALRAR